MDSPCLIESKSFKLYLNSYNEERFEYADIVRQRLHTDLSRVCGKPVHVEILSVAPPAFELSCAPLRGTSWTIRIWISRPTPDALPRRPNVVGTPRPSCAKTWCPNC